MIEHMVKPEAGRIEWEHYDALRAGILAELEAGRDPLVFMRKRCWGADAATLPAFRSWLVGGWPARRARLVSAGDYRPSDEDPDDVHQPATERGP